MSVLACVFCYVFLKRGGMGVEIISAELNDAQEE